MDADFHIIGITEHKILKDTFHYQPTETSHGGTGFDVKDSLKFIEKNDISFNITGDFESGFIELVIPNKKNVVAGCIYRHPSSPISVHQFNLWF